ncbi:hypothetical protein PAXRUDRAFT_776894 [Paxillus rubicundulus Ve08.2h10]|uniref:Unplaced genomic scaffold scaffold_207, whole genome shotgun sequence n=1 Tax=Paxillus rubicundulus Ve08.2h10 TaxID=930991 RepID=A0A0D0E3T9_9AGAM|nr:hypothetical protein PAXRUDRAFT_776894 [Paxillus rubicundulus Ve08.2h10]
MLKSQLTKKHFRSNSFSPQSYTLQTRGLWASCLSAHPTLITVNGALPLKGHTPEGQSLSPHHQQAIGLLLPTNPPSLGQPITPWPLSINHPSSTGLPYMPQPSFLGPPITSPIICTFFQSLGLPITYYYISVFHIPYCYMPSYLTLGHSIHYGQLHPWAHP